MIQLISDEAGVSTRVLQLWRPLPFSQPGCWRVWGGWGLWQERSSTEPSPRLEKVTLQRCPRGQGCSEAGCSPGDAGCHNCRWGGWPAPYVTVFFPHGFEIHFFVAGADRCREAVPEEPFANVRKCMVSGSSPGGLLFLGGRVAPWALEARGEASF